MLATSAPDPAALDFPFAAPPAPGTACVVAPGIRWIRMPLPFALDHINLWLLEDREGTTLVDTGIADDVTRSLWEHHFAHTLEGRPIARVLATHCHPDHLGNAAWIAERFDCGVTMTHGEFLTAHANIDERGAHAPADTRELFRMHGMTDEDLRVEAARGNRYRQGVPVAPSHYVRIQHGDRIHAAGQSWRVVSGYGHSPEHASLFAEAHDVFIAGDMLLPRISTNVSVWAYEPEGDPLGRFLASLESFESLPRSTLVLPSHGLPFRGVHVRVAQLRAHHAARLEELMAAMTATGAPVTAADVVPVLFRRELDVQQRFFAMGEAIAHLHHLWRRGRVARTRDAAGRYRFALQ